MRIMVVLFVMLALGGCASAPPKLHDPVVLGAGESSVVGPDDLELTLRYISEESGCVTATDCSTMLFHGSVAAKLGGGPAHLIQAQAVLRPGQHLRLDCDGYEFALTDVRRNDRNQLRATFIAIGRSVSPDKDSQDK